MKAIHCLVLTLLLTISSASLKAQNCDPWITQAYKELYNRTPNAEECNIRNYNNGSWNNYQELVGYIKNYNTKKTSVSKTELKGDPWIFQAYKELYNRQPNAWELNIKNYNDGSWNNYAELKKYVKEFRSSIEKAGMIIKTEQGKDNNFYVVFEKNGKPIAIDLVSAQGGTVVASGGANVVSAGGANVIAPGGGNVISPGGGNVVSAGGANFRIADNMAGVNFGSRYTVQSAGTTIVATSGKGALVIK